MATKPDYIVLRSDEAKGDSAGMGPRRRRWTQEVNWLEAASLFALGLGVFMLWGTPFVYPLKILVVFFHEMSHGIAAIATGGRVEEIQVNAFQGGYCVTRGGNRFTILSAGYMGSLLWGGGILLWTANARSPGRMTVGLGVVLAAVTAVLVRPFASFGFVFGMATGLVLVGIGLRMRPSVNAILLKAIGLTSCLYAVLDIKGDILLRPESRSDAAMLADLTGVPTVLWGLLWIGFAVLASVYFVAAACRRTPKPPPKRVTPILR